MLGSVPDPVATHATDWAGDPWAGDPWAGDPWAGDPWAGDAPADIRRLAQPAADDLVLAGEHTSVGYFGTVHGAHVSGIRAAERLMG